MSRRQAVREKWYWAVIRTDLVSGSVRELLSLVAVHHMTELGHVSVPRATLARELGIAEHRVTVRIGEAVKAGLLVRIAGGKNGQTMQYAAAFPDGQGVASRHPQPEVEVSGLRHPQNDTLKPAPGCRDPAPIRARVTSRTRSEVPAPDGSRGPEPHPSPNYGSNGDGATHLRLVAADPSAPRTQTGDARPCA